MSSIVSGVLEERTWETTHRFANGMYCREFFVKAGTIVIGQFHHAEHFIFALEGKITVFSDKGLDVS
jgi:hypothetical protein